MDFKMKNTLNVEIKGAKHFPVFTPGLANKELVEDFGLKQSMCYLDTSTPNADCLTIENLLTLYPKPMVEEMINYIKTKMPNATEKQIVLTILNI